MIGETRSSSEKIDDRDNTWVEAISQRKEAEHNMMIQQPHDGNKRDKAGKRRRFSRLEKLLLVVTLGCVVAVIVLAVKYNNAKITPSSNNNTQTDGIKSSTEKEPISKMTDEIDPACSTSRCSTARRVLQSIDRSVDPCDNFYDFACGGWMKTHTIPDDRSNLFVYGELRDKVQLTLKDLLENVEATDVNIENLKTMYESCTNTDLIEERNTSVIFPLLVELGGWPLLGDSLGGKWREETFSLETLLLTLMKYNNMPVIPSWVYLDKKNNSRQILYIDQAYFVMPNRKYYLDDEYDYMKTAYRTLMRNIATMIGADNMTVNDDVNDMLDLETSLANITMTREERRDPNVLYNKMTVADLQQNFTSQSFPFDWLTFLQGALQIPDDKVDITEKEEVVVESIPYFQQVFDVLSTFPKRTIANYVVWTFVKNRATNLPKTFTDELHTYYNVLYGSRVVRPRWKKCMRYVMARYGMTIGRLFVKNVFDERIKPEAQDMINYIREVFLINLDQVDWLDNKTKAYAREKAKEVYQLVGYPEYYNNDTASQKLLRNVSLDGDQYFENILQILQDDAKNVYSELRDAVVVDRTEWMTSPVIVNAFYQQEKNRMIFPAGILQAPYFDIDQPRSMNYGGIGFLMAHELIHGFDDAGRGFDKIGNLHNWWTSGSERKFQDRARCLIDQYNEFVSPEVNLTVNGINTQGENIADNGAVKRTFQAYRKWVSDHGEETLLPGLNFTHDQLFFLNIAQIRCGLSRVDDARSHILNGAHSPNRFRIIGSLQNMPDFWFTFKCRPGSYMRRAYPCAIW